jgi:hypothetical protein
MQHKGTDSKGVVQGQDATVVLAGYTHHVTQCSNRRQITFFYTEDYQYYLELMSEDTRQTGTEV